MSDSFLDIIVPVYNEGRKLILLLENFEKTIKTKFRVLFCYDDENDDIFGSVSNSSQKYNSVLNALEPTDFSYSTAALKL